MKRKKKRLKAGCTGSEVCNTNILKQVWISSSVAKDHSKSHHKQCRDSRRHSCVADIAGVVKCGNWEMGFENVLCWE